MIGMMARASTKMVATFVVVIVFFLICFAFAPWIIRGLQDVAEWMDNYLRTPPLNEQALILYRTLVNENTLLGIITTVVARMIVEIVSWVGGTYVFKSSASTDTSY
ncbi:MAG: hypothetical protein AAFX03_10595 [Pseudomonadota bacterium]